LLRSDNNNYFSVVASQTIADEQALFKQKSKFKALCVLLNF